MGDGQTSTGLPTRNLGVKGPYESSKIEFEAFI